MNLLEQLHKKFAHMERISPFLIRRYTKFGWDDCDEICEELREMRIKEGITQAPILHEKRTRKSKYRRMIRI